MIRDNNSVDSGSIRLGAEDYVWRSGQLLTADGRRVSLRAKALKMFAVLLTERGMLVSKDRLGELVWPDISVTDESIARCIADIRKALEDTSHTIVETFPKQGYRLNAIVALPDNPISPHQPAKRVLLLAATLCGIAVLIGGWWLSSAQDKWAGATDAMTRATTDLRKVVAILPFTALSPESAFFATGLSDDLEFRLAEFSGLRVVSQAQFRTMAGRPDTTVELARALEAHYLVTGKMRHSGGQIAASLQLIDGSDGTTVWAEDFEGSRAAFLGFRDGLPEELVSAMSAPLDARDRKRLTLHDTVVPEAFEQVMRARQELSVFTYEGNLNAEQHLRHALIHDPDYARAYAELAAAFAIRLENNWGVLTSADVEKALYFAKEALLRDPDLWLGHYALGRLHSMIPEGDVETALNHLRTAMSLQPANDDARVYYAVTTTMSGNPEKAMPLLESVMATHPHPPFWYYLGLGNTLFHLRRYEEAEQAISKCLRQMPSNPYCLRSNIAIFARQGRLEDAEWAVEEYEILGQDTGIQAIMKTAIERDPEMRAFLYRSYSLAGLN